MKKVLFIILVFVVSLFIVTPVFAETKDIIVKDISISDKSSTVSADDPVLVNNKITSLLKFNQVNDYVVYKLTIQNKESDRYKIVDITDNNRDTHLLIEYDYSDNYIDKDGDTTILLKLKYNSQLINSNLSLSDLNIKIALENEFGDSAIINPFTSDKIIPYLLAFFISVISFMFAFKSRRIKQGTFILVFALLVVPYVVYARTDFEIGLGFTNATVLGEFEDYTVTINSDNGDELITRTITYGNKVGDLPVVSKDLYTFEKWVDQNNNTITSDTIVRGNLTIVASWLSDCHSFATDSWTTIIANISNNSTYYGVGCTKPITINVGNGDEVHNLRIANNTTPDVCSTAGYSQTACGVVLEFEDIIANRLFSPWIEGKYENGNGNMGSWKYSDMRSFLNNDFYQVLPTDLRNIIIDTYTYTSRSKNDTDYYDTTDKIYLFSTKEIWGEENDANPIETDDAMDVTRQLDYYSKKGVSVVNFSDARKKFGSEYSNWWLRSASNVHVNRFFTVEDDGDHHRARCNDGSDNGYSPAFRIH